MKNTQILYLRVTRSNHKQKIWGPFLRRGVLIAVIFVLSSPIKEARAEGMHYPLCPRGRSRLSTLAGLLLALSLLNNEKINPLGSERDTLWHHEFRQMGGKDAVSMDSCCVNQMPLRSNLYWTSIKLIQHRVTPAPSWSIRIFSKAIANVQLLIGT